MRRTKTLVVVAVALILAAQRPVFASDDNEEPPKPEESSTDGVWYGLPIIVTDVVSDSLLLFAPPFGLAGIALGAPLIHMGHGHGGMALASLGLRLTAELVGFVRWIKTIDGDDLSAHDRMIPFAPIVAVQILDASLLAWNPRPRRAVLGKGVLSPWNVAASMTFSDVGASFGLAGSF